MNWSTHESRHRTLSRLDRAGRDDRETISDFVPIVRTFALIVAGIGAMHYGTFLSFNAIGGLIWTFAVTLLGYSLGALIPDVDKYLLPIVLGIIVVSLLPSILHLYPEHKPN